MTLYSTVRCWCAAVLLIAICSETCASAKIQHDKEERNEQELLHHVSITPDEVDTDKVFESHHGQTELDIGKHQKYFLGNEPIEDAVQPVKSARRHPKQKVSHDQNKRVVRQTKQGHTSVYPSLPQYNQYGPNNYPQPGYPNSPSQPYPPGQQGFGYPNYNNFDNASYSSYNPSSPIPSGNQIGPNQYPQYNNQYTTIPPYNPHNPSPLPYGARYNHSQPQFPPSYDPNLRPPYNQPNGYNASQIYPYNPSSQRPPYQPYTSPNYPQPNSNLPYNPSSQSPPYNRPNGYNPTQNYSQPSYPYNQHTQTPPYSSYPQQNNSYPSHNILPYDTSGQKTPYYPAKGHQPHDGVQPNPPYNGFGQNNYNSYNNSQPYSPNPPYNSYNGYPSNPSNDNHKSPLAPYPSYPPNSQHQSSQPGPNNYHDPTKVSPGYFNSPY